MNKKEEYEGLKPLQHIGTPYFQNIFKNDTKIRQYHSNKIPFARYKNSKRIFYLDITEACRIIALGMNRTGKTFLMRSFGDRLMKTNHSLVYLTDVKDEFKSSLHPVQEKFRDGLLEGEHPEGFKIATLRPTFFKLLRQNTSWKNALPVNNHWFSPKMTDISRSNFLRLLDNKRLTSNQQTYMELIYNKLTNKANKGEKVDISDVDKIIDELEDVTQNSRAKLKNKFKSLKNSHFTDVNYERDIIKYLQKDITLAFNMEGFEDFIQGHDFPRTFISIIMNKLIKARRKKRIKPLWMMADEAARFVSSGGNTTTQEDFLLSADLDSKYDINYFYIYQNMSSVPQPLLDQCKYLLVPYNAKIDMIREVILEVGLANKVHTAKNEAIKLRKKMDEYEWIVINTNLGTKDIVKPLPPLSRHMETGD